ncbi:Haloacid dehalogenase, type II, partial [Pseudomonas amygdali pv. tabaci]
MLISRCCNEVVLQRASPPLEMRPDCSSCHDLNELSGPHTMSFLRPKFITFDCYGTLTNFHMGTMTRELFADRVPAEQMDQFVKDFSAYRLDQVMGDWMPYDEILKVALARTCKRWNVEYREEGQLYYDAVPTWGPHADVPAGLSKI